MRVNFLHREQKIPASLPEVFAFFSEARNLKNLTPPWLRFELVEQRERELKAGTLIRYQLAWNSLRLKWTTRIEEWQPPKLFIDIQLKGPYRLWRHCHSFWPCDGGTLMKDEVHYALPMGALGEVIAGKVVRRDLERVFDFRAQQIAAIFPAPPVAHLRSADANP